MKVKELIKRLEGFNPEADICLEVTGLICSEDIELGYIAGKQVGAKFHRNSQNYKASVHSRKG